jgi:type III restriction enzyme
LERQHTVVCTSRRALCSNPHSVKLLGLVIALFVRNTGFVKNERLNFSIPYLYNGQEREYYPDFIIRLKSTEPRYLIFETKGYRYDGTEEKKAGAERWCRAVNADGRFGTWEYRLCKSLEVIKALDEIQKNLD